MAEGRSAWHFEYRREPGLPALAWLATVGGGSAERVVRVRCGASVRCEAGGFIEGTWIGDGGLAELPRSTTIFGSGMAGAAAALVGPLRATYGLAALALGGQRRADPVSPTLMIGAE